MIANKGYEWCRGRLCSVPVCTGLLAYTHDSFRKYSQEGLLGGAYTGSDLRKGSLERGGILSWPWKLGGYSLEDGKGTLTIWNTSSLRLLLWYKVRTQYIFLE